MLLCFPYYNTILYLLERLLSLIHNTDPSIIRSYIEVCGNKQRKIQVITYKDVENRIVTIRGLKVILDRNVADLYQVEAKRVNEAVSRNADKFPEGYLMS